MKILLVDRCVFFREGLKPMLRHVDPDSVITEADNYGEALKISKQQPDIALVFLGLMLPRRHGLDGIKHLRMCLPTTLIIALSDFEREEDVRRILDCGANGYVSKSCTPATMLSAMSLALSGGAYLFPVTGICRHATPQLAGSARRNGDLSTNLSARLTKRQLEVLQLLTQGMTNKQIGRELTISFKTVKTHITTILKTLDAANRTEAGTVASQLNLVSGPRRLN